jgi:MFS family permease
VIGGVIADFFGRRPSLALSLTLYGASSALAGLIQTEAAFSLMYIMNGFSWGILFMSYSFVIWGDLANEKNVAKIYAIGLATYFSALGFGLLFPQTSQIPLMATALLTCLLVFFLNVPIILAPELLSNNASERMRLQMHMNAVKRIRKKQKN